MTTGFFFPVAIVITTVKKKTYSRLSGGCAIVITTGKKRYSHLSGGCAIIITTGKKKIESSVWRVRNRFYDRKKKDTVVCLAGARLLLRLEKLKDTVVCLASTRWLLRPEKKSSSRLSGRCAIVITTGK